MRYTLTILALNFLFAIHGQPTTASCVSRKGIALVSDAILASVGACNCEKAPVFISEFKGCDEGNFQLELEDNFDGDSLDREKWMKCPWIQGSLDNSQGLGYAKWENVSISNGVCHAFVRKEKIIARVIDYEPDNKIMQDGRPNLREFDYTRSSIFSKRLFLYGKYEIRFKMPAGNGLWPAFWMYGGKRGNEIDFFDNYAGTTVINTMIGHDFDGNGKASNCTASYNGFDFTDWHTVSCIFDFYIPK